MHVDWSTLALQTVNVLILVWILGRFLFRPLRAIVAQRQAKASALLAEADALKQRAVEEDAAADRARKEIDARKEELIAEGQAEADKEKARVVDAAQKDVAQLREEAHAAAAREKAAMEEALIAHVRTLAVEITRRLIARISPDAGLDGFIDGLCAELDKLPLERRKALLLGRKSDEPIEIITAAPLSSGARTRLREKLVGHLGGDIMPTFSVDPDLIAGIELTAGTISLRNSLRQDLDHIAKELDFET